MNTLRIAFPVALLAVLTVVSIGHALPSCCEPGSGNNQNVTALPYSGTGGGLKAPQTGIRVQYAQPAPRQATARVQTGVQVNPGKWRRAVSVGTTSTTTRIRGAELLCHRHPGRLPGAGREFLSCVWPGETIGSHPCHIERVRRLRVTLSPVMCRAVALRRA